MKYLLLICADESVRFTPEESAAIGRATESWGAEVDARGCGGKETACGP